MAPPIFDYYFNTRVGSNVQGVPSEFTLLTRSINNYFFQSIFVNLFFVQYKTIILILHFHEIKYIILCTRVKISGWLPQKKTKKHLKYCAEKKMKTVEIL